MTSTWLRPVALAGNDVTAALPASSASASLTRATFLALATSFLVPVTSSMPAPEDPPLEVQRLASERTHGGGLGEQVAPERSLAEAVVEIRRRSGLTWEQLARLLGVERRSVHLWASGRPLNAANAERVGRVLAIVRRADRGTPSATKAWLLGPTASGELPLDLLRAGRFEELRLPAVASAPARPRPLSETAKIARSPSPPEQLVGARSDRIHVERGKLIKAVPIKLSKSK